MKKYLYIMLLVFIAGKIFGAGKIISQTPEALTYRQVDGLEVKVPLKPKRAIVAYGSLTKIWDLAGGAAVGVPTVLKDALPESMLKLPRIGSATSPDLEKILMLNPDLVLLIAKVQRHRMAAELLRSSGVSTLSVKYDNYKDFYELLDLFCRINGKTVNDVPEVRKIKAQVSRICDQAKQLKPPTCAVVFASASGFSLESAQANTGMIVDMLGAKNIVKDTNAARGNFRYEQLLLDNPDVIVIVTMGNAEGLREKFRREVTSQPAWQSMSAAKNKRVHFLPSELFLYIPGPDYPRSFKYMAELLYPEAEFSL
ncbi:MAG: ABC transporter substrate-binding protein [Victivallales bacterium]|nr:ABC transporter substrate-binding protein [Victivallales bacterium]